METTITAFAERHVAGAAELERACFAAPWTESALREELDNPNAVFLAAEQDGQTVGYLGCHLILDEGYIANVAVSPACRKQGIGSLLVAELLRRLTEKQAAFVTLEVRVSNAPAIALYEKHGFEPVGTRRNFYDAPKEDALLMTAYLNRE